MEYKLSFKFCEDFSSFLFFGNKISVKQIHKRNSKYGITGETVNTLGHKTKANTKTST